MFRHPQNPARPSNAEGKKIPEVPISPYIRFSRKQWQVIRAENSNLQLWEISDLIKEKWEKLSPPERALYQQEHDLEMAEYEKIMRQLNGSSAVATAIKAKVKGSKAKADSGNTAIVRTPVEEEEQQPSELTARRMHAIRFDRNHRLVVDLFNSTTVFDSRVVVPQKRLTLLQRQAQNLEVHRNKLEDELKKLQEAFESKKRHLQQSSANFDEQLHKVCRQRVEVSKEKYAEMVGDWEGKLAAAYALYKKNNEPVETAQTEEMEEIAKSTPLLFAMTASPQATLETNLSPGSAATNQPPTSNAEQNFAQPSPNLNQSSNNTNPINTNSSHPNALLTSSMESNLPETS